jgi:trehalose 6-phosphate phosphatase
MIADHLPSAFQAHTRIKAAIGDRRIGFFLDFDGTLAPIAPRPDAAVLPERCRAVLKELGRHHLVCILSGRTLDDLRQKTGLTELYYGGDHGYRISGPQGSGVELRVGDEARGELESAGRQLRERLADVPGVVLEMKEFSLSVHYRLAAIEDEPLIANVTEQVSARYPSLRMTEGKCAHELRPAMDWGKGEAMLWILDRLGLDRQNLCPIVLGDDVTDEDMFRAAAGWGVCVLVGPAEQHSEAEYRLDTPEQAAEFLAWLRDVPG